jgi:serine/threonine protein kinase/membrane protein implicated in regulation of membrane protease activity
MLMLVTCPHCQHGLNVARPNPGRYTSRCTACKAQFILKVSDDASKPPVVVPFQNETRNDAMGAGVAAPAPADMVATLPVPASSSGIVDPEAETISEMPITRSRSSSEDEPTEIVPGAVPSGGTAETVPGGAAAADDRAYASAAGNVPNYIGGYHIEKMLGRGGMGDVYLARQLSLDRDVALKTMKPEWARNPTFVSRFVREAYAAAQLNHHNVVQIYDFGEDKGTRFFSMEFVPGKSLSDVLRASGKLDPEVAAGFILQAARGLKFAHERGMIHRDIKPDNLMISELGVVKVADLGLVKTPAAVAAEVTAEPAPAGARGPSANPAAQSRSADSASANVTAVDVAMGTPAYMAPEQGKDAASVDARADIYSLGCTLYTLVTGRPPFDGASALEVITKHQTQPVVPPDLVVKRVPKELSGIILKMVAKKPEERYPTLDGVIADLERYLGLSTTGPFTPKEEHADLLEKAVQEYNNVPLAMQRPKIVWGYLGGCLLLALLCILARQPLAAGGFVGLAILTLAATFVISGITRKTYLFQKVRELAFGSKWGDWLTVLAGIVLILVVLYVFKLLWVWVAFCIAAVLIAVGLYTLVDRKIGQERDDSLNRVEAMLKGMRLHALDESALRQFVCKYAGEHWEEFFEDLFGYEAKITAREQWGRGERSRSRPRFAAWRDPIIRWIDAKQRARREAAEKQKIQDIEEKSLVAQGVNLLTARRQSQRSAAAMVERASELRTLNATMVAAATLSADEIRARSLKSVLEAAGQPEKYLAEREQGLEARYRTTLFDVILGPRVRFIAGALLLAGCGLWIKQNNLISGEEIKNLANVAVETKDAGKAADAGTKSARVVQERATRAKALKLPIEVPAISNLFRDFNPGIAGLLLIVSSFFAGWRLTLFVVPAAAIIVLGRSLGIPGYEPYVPAEWSSLVVGLAIAGLGVLYSRGR